MINKNLQKFAAIVLFIVMAVNAVATVIYARSAEDTARQVKTDLDGLKITTQNKCIVRMVLSYPPPVPQEQFPIILTEYDACIAAQERQIEKELED